VLHISLKLFSISKGLFNFVAKLTALNLVNPIRNELTKIAFRNNGSEFDFGRSVLGLKKVLCLLLTLCLLTCSAFVVFAEAEKPQNEVMLLGNDGGYGWAKFHLANGFSITGVYEDELAKLGLRYDPSERFGIKAGQVYDPDTEETFTYGGINFIIPFGNSLNIAGFYDINYKYKDWDRYEAALKIQMAKNHYIYAGIRGDAGVVPELKYNEDNLEEPHMFLRGDFNWSWKKFSISLDPLLYVKGYYYHDYTFKYHINEKANVVLNVSNYDDNPNNPGDSEINYRGGFEFKF